MTYRIAPGRQKIISAFQALLRQKAYEDISIVEIAKTAGVSRSTYYRSFKRKEDIVEAYADQLLNEIRGGIMEKYGCELRHIDIRSRFEFLFEFYRPRGSDILSLYSSGFGSLLLDIVNRYAEYALGDMPYSSVEKYKIYFVSGAMYNILLKWLEDGAADEPSLLADTCTRYFLSGIGNI